MSNLLFESPFTSLVIIVNLYMTWSYFKLSPLKQKEIRLYPYSVSRGQNTLSLLSSMFVHSNWMHFSVNMFTLLIFGEYLEHKLGPLNYMTIYFISGITASIVLTIKFYNNPQYSALGASGATSGIVFGFIMLNPNADLQFILIPIPFKAYIFGIGYLMYSYYQSKKGQDGIAHEAHIAGALSGALMIFLYNNLGY